MQFSSDHKHLPRPLEKKNERDIAPYVDAINITAAMESGDSNQQISHESTEKITFAASEKDNHVDPESLNKQTIFVSGDYVTSEEQKNILKQMQQRFVSSETNNKIEIDSDNIETPPTARKNHGKLFKINQILDDIDISKHDKNNTTIPDAEILGNGQFDRFSSARRTRRYKRSVDLNYSPIENEAQKSSVPILSSELLAKDENAKDPISPIKKIALEPGSSSNANKVENNEVVKRIGKIGKSISRISQEDVREALLTLRKNKSSPESEWNKNGISQISSNKLQSSTSSKIISHELNDEGFEETQSLVSDTPSLTTSSCNDEGKTKENSSGGSINKKPSPLTLKRKTVKPSSQLQSLLTRNQQSLEKSRSLRNGPTHSNTKILASPSAPPRKANSFKKVDKSEKQQKIIVATPIAAANKHFFIKRSNSRTSLISSISSLNSTISTNTVKKMPLSLKSNSSSSTMSNLTKKPPLISISNASSSSTIASKTNAASSKVSVAASRSSSSGSSIGQQRPLLVPKTVLSSKTTKDNLQSNRFKSITSRSSQNVSQSSNGNNKSSFMKQTTASATKIKSK